MSSKSLKFDKTALLLLCKLSQQTERYEQMVDFIDEIYKSESQLTIEERNLCATGYKNIVGIKRAELKTLQSLQYQEENRNIYHNKMIYNKSVADTRQSIVKQLTNHCKRILGLIDSVLMPRVKSVQDKIFYLKMKGDYNRYLSQFSKQNQECTCLQIARYSYQEADNLARSNLASTNPVRLGLHLNMSVFCYQILGKYEKALQLANRAFEDAIANIDNVNEVDYKDCTFIMQLLRDNITLWSV